MGTQSPRAYACAAMPSPLSHLELLESESIHILREAAAEARRPVMLYSMGKDSAMMLHLARKAFWPAPPPFPLLHVDPTWKFRDSPYEAPLEPELHLDTTGSGADDCLARLLDRLG